MQRIILAILCAVSLTLILLACPVPAAWASAPPQAGEKPADAGAIPGTPAGSLADELARQQSRELDMGEIERFWNELRTKYSGYFPGEKLPEIGRLMFPQGEPMHPAQIIGGLFRYFLHEVLFSGKLLVTIVLLTVFTMVLETMQTAFERNAVSKVAYGIAYLVLLFLAVGSFRSATGYAGEAIERMIQFMLAMVPLLLTLLASTGGFVTVAVLHPLIVFMIHAVGTVIHLFVFPLLFFSAVLHIVSSISERYSVTQLANLLRTIGAGAMGVMFTVFLGVLSIQGLTGAAADGVAIRTAKFVAGNFIPVVGKMFSDATDTVLTASLLVKNAIGIAGVVILLFLCAFPAIKILTLALIYNVAGAVLQPLGNSPVVATLQTIGKTLVFIFAAMASVALMFFLAVTIILMAGNAPLLMR